MITGIYKEDKRLWADVPRPRAYEFRGIYPRGKEAWEYVVKEWENRPSWEVSTQLQAKWKVGERYEEGKNFIFQEQEDYIGGSGHTAYPTFSQICIPIETIEDKPIKPPLGLMPRWRHIELRIDEINDAADRMIEKNYEVPIEYWQEQNELLLWLKKHLPTSPYLLGIDLSVIEDKPKEMFTLSEAWEIWNAGFDRAWEITRLDALQWKSLDSKQYFLQKFNITLSPE